MPGERSPSCFLRSYQDSTWEVAEAAGRVVEQLECFLGEDGHPEKFLLRLSEVGWAECYLDAWLGFWHLLDEAAAERVREDYDGSGCDDVGKRLGLVGHPVRRVTCSWSSLGTVIEFHFEAGTLRLVEVDSKDPDSSSRLEWKAAGQEGGEG